MNQFNLSGRSSYMKNNNTSRISNVVYMESAYVLSPCMPCASPESFSDNPEKLYAAATILMSKT